MQKAVALGYVVLFLMRALEQGISTISRHFMTTFSLMSVQDFAPQEFMVSFFPNFQGV